MFRFRSPSLVGIITLTKHPQDVDGARQADALTPAMIEAGVVALEGRGYGEGETTDQLRAAVQAVFGAMVAASRPCRNRRGTECPLTA